jgi:phosphotransferase system  glucose/maltose/N-acetylglucosamine-specific IIC component
VGNVFFRELSGIFMNGIGNAFELIFIGLIVAISLYFIRKFIIRFVNRYTPDLPYQSIENTSSNPRVNSKKIAALVSTVDVVTNSKGRIRKVEKIG